MQLIANMSALNEFQPLLPEEDAIGDPDDEDSDQDDTLPADLWYGCPFRDAVLG